MKLFFKQRFFSWFDSYDVYYENGEVAFSVEGKLSWGHCLKIFDGMGKELGTVQERVLTFLPKFEMYFGDSYVGCITKEFSLFKPRFSLDCADWYVEGDFFEWDYEICSQSRGEIATVSKELWNWTDTYTIDVAEPRDSLLALMVVLAIDAENCSRN